MTRTMTFRSCVLLGSIVLSLQVTHGQERAPNGEIYNELRPFVGLDGVRYDSIETIILDGQPSARETLRPHD